MKVATGDILIMKKKHPCGSIHFQVIDIGVNLTVKCIGCGREITVSRPKLLKNVKEVNKLNSGGSNNVW